MRPVSKVLLGAGAVAALAGAALAADRPHVLDVAMPDGSIAHVRYIGDVPPRVTVVVPPAVTAFPAGLFETQGSPVAMLDRLAADMDRQVAAMMRTASVVAATADAVGGRVDPAALAPMPAGTLSYSMVSYSSGDGGTCSRSVRVTALRAGEAPKIVQQSAGDCRAMERAPAPAVAHQPQPADPVTEVGYTPAPAKPRPTPIV